MWSLGGFCESEEVFCRDTEFTCDLERGRATVGLLLSGCGVAERVSVW